MRKALILVLVVMGIAYGVFEVSGYRYVLRAEGKIGELPAEAQRKAEQDLYYGVEGETSGGLLIGVWANRVWMWGERGVEIWRLSDQSVYSYFDGCGEEVRKPIDPEKPVAIPREVTSDQAAWRAILKKGDFVGVFLMRDGTDQAREVWVYNWWYFLPRPMEELCAR